MLELGGCWGWYATLLCGEKGYCEIYAKIACQVPTHCKWSWKWIGCSVTLTIWHLGIGFACLLGENMIMEDTAYLYSFTWKKQREPLLWTLSADLVDLVTKKCVNVLQIDFLEASFMHSAFIDPQNRPAFCNQFKSVETLTPPHLCHGSKWHHFQDIPINIHGRKFSLEFLFITKSHTLTSVFIQRSSDLEASPLSNGADP